MSNLYRVTMLVIFPDGNEMEANKVFAGIDEDAAISAAIDEIEDAIQHTLEQLDSDSQIGVEVLDVVQVDDKGEELFVKPKRVVSDSLN